MKVSTRAKEGVSIVDLGGRLIVADSRTLQETIRALLAKGTTRILINLQGLDMMDSSGLGELVSAKESAAQRGATVKLLYAADKVRAIPSMARIIGTFEAFVAESDAIASFRAG